MRSIRPSDLPAAAVHSAKIYVLDSLGVPIAGSSLEGGEGLLRVASGWGDPPWVSGSRGAPAPRGCGLRLMPGRCTTRNTTACMRQRSCMPWPPYCQRRWRRRKCAGGCQRRRAGSRPGGGGGHCRRAGACLTNLGCVLPGRALPAGFAAVAAAGARSGPRPGHAGGSRLCVAACTGQRHDAGACRREARFCRCRWRSMPALRCNPASWECWGLPLKLGVRGAHGYLALFVFFRAALF